jgi:hypothetical protein
MRMTSIFRAQKFPKHIGEGKAQGWRIDQGGSELQLHSGKIVVTRQIAGFLMAADSRASVLQGRSRSSMVFSSLNRQAAGTGDATFILFLPVAS